MSGNDTTAPKNQAPRSSDESEGPSPAELKAAREAVAALATAAKSFTLYPAGHVMAQRQIDTLSRAMATFFEQAPELTLAIGREGLVYRDNLLYRPLPDDDPLLPPLLRDGFLWIAFLRGVEPDQLAFFLEVVNRYRVLVDEPEGDLVTELWQADLKRIRYEAIEEFWDDKPRFDFSHFSVWPEADAAGDEVPSAAAADEQDGPAGGSTATDQGAQASARRTKAAIQIEQPTTRRELMRLSEKEQAVLQAQVEALDAKDNTAAVRDILLFTLAQQRNGEDFNRFLAVLHDLLFDQLYHRQAGHFHDLLRGVRRLQKNTAVHWQRRAVGEFIHTLSSPATWEGQTRFFHDLHTLSPTEQQHVTGFIDLLAPPFIAVLAPELGRVRGSALHQNLVTAAAKLAGRNIQAVERCISGSDEATLRQIVMILGEMRGEGALALLKRMGRHPAGGVREVAVKTLLAKSSPSIATTLAYLDDPHPGVRNAALDHLSRNKNPQAEAALRDYIQSDPEIDQDEDRLLACYQALGRCGGRESVAFLKKTLLNRSAGNLLHLGGSAHQLGAALALKHCPGDRAEQVLRKAAKSLFPAIRNAARRAMAAKETVHP